MITMAICEKCGQQIKLAHKEILTATKLNMLKRAAGHVMDTMKNDFMVRDIAERSEFKRYNNFQKLRYHGLVTPVKSRAGVRIKGRWLITRNGWAFLRGELTLPKWVTVRNNRIESWSGERITIKQILFQDATIDTTFEYFDEHGMAVGFRPSLEPSPTNQGSLL